MNVLLVDFGASRVKAVLWSLDQNRCLDSYNVPSPSPIFGKKGEVEVNPYHYVNIWHNIFTVMNKYGIDETWICSEMHGFIIVDFNGKAITNYISWKDSRGSIKGIEKEKFLTETGMRLCPGLPIVTLKQLNKQNKLPNNFHILTLVDFLLWADGNYFTSNETLLAGTGLYSIKTRNWHPLLFKLADLDINNVILSPITSINKPLGNVDIFGGVGDLQAAINGANIKENSILVNLGTGSQIIIPSNYKDSSIIGSPTTEKRIGVNGEVFSAITHIPCGRALDVFANFLGHTLFWNWFAVLESRQILKSKIEIIMNVFTSGGFICNIKEKNFTQRTFMEGLALSWLKQYTRLIEDLDPQNVYKRIYVSGGLSRRLPFIKPVLEALSGREVQLVKPITGEETLDGLLKLAQEKNNGG